MKFLRICAATIAAACLICGCATRPIIVGRSPALLAFRFFRRGLRTKKILLSWRNMAVLASLVDGEQG
jgi:hypothetical protein